MELFFLGTSSGVPTQQRNVSALVLKTAHARSWCLVDCGEATQHQLLRTSFSLMHLEVIFITHVHGDHCYGLPGLLASASMAGRTAVLKIVAPPGIETFVRTTLNVTAANLRYDIEFIPADGFIGSCLANKYAVSSSALSHRVPSYGYVFEEAYPRGQLNVDKLLKDRIAQGPVWGKLAQGENVASSNGTVLQADDYLFNGLKRRKIIIGGDNDSPERLCSAAKNADLLVHEATYTQAVQDKVGPGPQHSSAASVAKFASEQKIPFLILTHFSARYHQKGKDGHSLKDIEDEAKKYYSQTVFLACDFDHYIVSSDGVTHHNS